MFMKIKDRKVAGRFVGVPHITERNKWGFPKNAKEKQNGEEKKPIRKEDLRSVAPKILY